MRRVSTIKRIAAAITAAMIAVNSIVPAYANEMVTEQVTEAVSEVPETDPPTEAAVDTAETQETSPEAVETQADTKEPAAVETQKETETVTEASSVADTAGTSGETDADVPSENNGETETSPDTDTGETSVPDVTETLPEEQNEWVMFDNMSQLETENVIYLPVSFKQEELPEGVYAAVKALDDQELTELAKEFAKGKDISIQPAFAAEVQLYDAENAEFTPAGPLSTRFGLFDETLFPYDNLSLFHDDTWKDLDMEFIQAEKNAYSAEFKLEDSGTLMIWKETDETETGQEETGDASGTETSEPEYEFFCGMEEHAHDESCYDEAGNLTCGLEEHTHSEVCLEPAEGTETETSGPEYEFFCGKEEHTHDESCYDEAGNLVCGMEEHTHSEVCLEPAEETETEAAETEPESELEIGENSAETISGPMFILSNAIRLNLLDALVDNKLTASLIAISPSGSEYTDPEKKEIGLDEAGEWKFTVRLTDMLFQDGIIQEGAVYEYALPDGLIPVPDDEMSSANPDDPSTWPMLTSNGRAQARGYLENKDGHYSLLIMFLEGTTESEAEISAAYQYNAVLNLDADRTEDGVLEFPFSGSKTFSVKLTETEKSDLHIEKSVQWLDDDNEETGTNETGSNYGWRRIKYTVTLKNPTPEKPFSGTLTDTVDGKQIIVHSLSPTTYCEDDFTVEAWINETTIDGKKLTGGALTTEKELGDTGSTPYRVKFEDDQDVTFQLFYSETQGPCLIGNSITVTLKDVTFETFTYSYITTIYDFSTNGTGSTRRYTTTTNLSYEGGSESLMGMGADKYIQSPDQEGPLSCNPSCSQGDGQNAKYDFSITVNPRGENWVKLKLDSSGEYYLTLYSHILTYMNLGYGSSSSYPDYRIGNDPSITYSGGWAGAPVGMYDPASYMEIKEFFTSQGMNNSPYVNCLLWSSIKGVDGRTIWLVVDKETIDMSSNIYSGGTRTNDSPYYLPLQYSAEKYYGDLSATSAQYGKPYNPTIYLFGLEGKPVKFSYTKYNLVYSVDGTTYGQEKPSYGRGWQESVIASNGYSGISSGTNIGIYNSNYAEGKNLIKKAIGFIQEDGSIRWDNWIDMSPLNTFYEGLRNSNSNVGRYDSMNAGFDIFLNGSISNFKLKQFEENSYDENGLILPDSDSSAYLKRANFSRVEKGSGTPDIYLNGYASLELDKTYCTADTGNWDRETNPSLLNYPLASRMGSLSDYDSAIKQFSNYDQVFSWIIKKYGGSGNENINSFPGTIKASYVTIPQSNFNPNRNREVRSLLNIQIYNNSLLTPVVDNSKNAAVAFPALHKNISVELDEENALKETIHSHVSTYSSSSSCPFNGVFYIHDDMSESAAFKTIKDKDVSYEEPLAKYIKLKNMHILISTMKGSPQAEFTTIEEGENKITFSVNGKTVTAYLDYNGDMQSGFDLKITPLEDVMQIDITYDCTFDTSEYAKAASATGVVNTKFVNGAKLNYSLLKEENSGKITSTTSSFSYAASPSTSLKWLDEKQEENLEKGLYVNNYYGETDIGPSAWKEVYIADQITQIKELMKKAGGEWAGEGRSLEKFLPYISAQNIRIQVANRRSEDEPVTIYEEGHAVSGDWQVTEIPDPKTSFSPAPVPEGEGNKAIDGNMFAFSVKKADSTAMAPQTYFIVTFDIVLTPEKDLDGKSFRDIDEYLGGTLMMDDQLSICYPFSPAFATASIPGWKSIASDWVTAGESVGGIVSLKNPDGVKTLVDSEQNLWELRFNTGTRGKTEKVTITAGDILSTFASVNGKAVTDDTLNKKLLELLFKHLKVTVDGIWLKEISDENKVYPEPGIIGPTFTVDVYDPETDLFSYVDAKTSEEEHGWGSIDILDIVGSNLPYNEDVIVRYQINIDWQTLLEEVLKEKLIENDDELSFTEYRNVMDFDEQEIRENSKFQNPASVMGTITKTASADWDKQEISWNISLDTKGNQVKGYTLTDILKAGTTSATDNDELALQYTDLTSFEIWSGESMLYEHKGSFANGTKVSIPDSDLWKDAELTFTENAGFGITFGTLLPCSMEIRYTTKLDEAGFIENGGNMSQGYGLTNTVTGQIPGAKLESDHKEEFEGTEEKLEKTVAASDGRATDKEWKITIPVQGQYAKDIRIEDNVSATPEGVLDFLSISSMKVELSKDGEVTTVYDTSDGTDHLADHTGAFEDGFIAGKDGVHGFALTFETLPEGTDVIVTYRTSINTDAYRNADRSGSTFNSNNHYTLKNSAAAEQAGWNSRSTSKSDTVDIPDEVTKKGTVKSKATDGKGAIVEWSVDVFLDSIVEMSKLQQAEDSAEAAEIQDILPYGLAWVKDYNVSGVKVQELTASSSGTWSAGSEIPGDAYEAVFDGDNPQKLTVRILKPATYSRLRITFQTEAVSNLGDTMNSVTVNISGVTRGDRSDKVPNVFTRKNGGVVTSLTYPKVVLTAMKTLDGGQPGSVPFTFRAVEMEDTGSGYSVKAGGYDQTAQCLSDGSIAFPETGFLTPGDYYYRIAEVPDTSKDAPAYEGTAYKWDTSEYIVHVHVARSDDGYAAETEVLSCSNNDVDVSGLEEPLFANTTQPLRSVTVNKNWADSDNKNGWRPDSIQVKLKRNGSVYDARPDATAELNAANGWSYTWEDLPYNGTYDVEEVSGFDNEELYVKSKKGPTGAIPDETFTLSNSFSVWTKGLDLDLTGTKNLTGRKINKDEFEFTLEAVSCTDKKGRPVEYSYSDTAKVKEDGTFAFNRISYDYAKDIGKTFVYEVKETNNKLGGVTYDSTVYTVTVKILFNEDTREVTLSKTITDGKGGAELVFNNTYDATGDIVLKTSKALDNATLTAGLFSFELLASDKDWTEGAVLQEKSNGTAGDVSAVVFDKITYQLADAPGEFYYLVREKDTGLTGITYDADPVKIKVTVTDHGDGTLDTASEAVGGKASFTNSFAGTFTVTKQDAEDGHTLEGAEFTVYDSKDAEVGKFSTGKDGTGTLGSLKEGSYYAVETKAPEGYIIQKDASGNPLKYGFSVSVDEPKASVTVKDDFERHSLSVSKTVKGNVGNRAYPFTFHVWLSGGMKNMPDKLDYTVDGEKRSAQVTDGYYEFKLADGETALFTDIPYGTEYRIEEMDGKSNSYKVDATNEKGTITDKDITAEFVNTKNGTIPTDSHYFSFSIGILILIAVAGFLLLLRKREH